MGNNSDTVLKLKTLSVEFSEPGWDGYGAEPASERSVGRSISLVESLLDFRFKPYVGVDPDGFVFLEWYRDRNDQCLVTVSDDGKVFLDMTSGDSNWMSKTCDLSSSTPEISSMLLDFGVFSQEKESL